MRKWYGLLALMPATALIFLDQTVLPVALPVMQKHLNATTVELEWCVNSYLLLTTVLVLAGGKIGDWIGHRKSSVLGLLIFIISSVLCALSVNVELLIIARGLQGIGAALMIPAQSPILMSLFPPSERSKATGIAASVGSIFLILGPFIGGYFTEYFSWRLIFWINLPLGILGMIMLFLFIPRSPPSKHRFDLWGFIYFCASCSSLVIVLMQGREWGWNSLKIYSLLVVWIVSTVFLLRREKKAQHPFLDLSLFKHPVFRAVNISIFAIQFIMMITVFRAIFFQETLAWSPMKTGSISVISSVPVLFMSPICGYLSDKYTPKLPIGIGFVLLILSAIWLPLIIQSSTAMILIGLFAFGLGLPFIFTPSYSSAMGAVPPTKAGAAFGIIATLRSLSATLGVAILGFLINEVEWHRLKSLVQENQATQSVQDSVLKNILSGTADALKSLSIEQTQLVTKFLSKAQISGFFYSHMILAVLLLIAFAFVFVLYHRKSAHHLPEAPAEGWD